MDRDETGMNVVLIDNKEQLDAIKEEYPGLAKRFECIDGNIQSSQPKPPIKEEKAPEAPVGPKAPAKAPEPVPPSQRGRCAQTAASGSAPASVPGRRGGISPGRIFRRG